ncbi:unnamed protein product [Calicophoron daubneyi]|uniref:Voltage-dependent calcium channel alpha-2/delta subunit conserved region domain-containing protein n=1 Tax=Calicophoron daubneyi TaxID=300641 RepID=A0AAV2T8K7_CALDB
MMPSVVGTNLPADGGSKTDNYTCIKLNYRYFVPHDDFDGHFKDEPSDASNMISGWLNCTEECGRDWSVRTVEGTNLKLVVADPPCEKCGELDELLPRDPIEDSGPDVCELSVNPRYRRPLDRCPPERHKHDPLACGAVRPLSQVTCLIYSFLVLSLHLLFATEQ